MKLELKHLAPYLPYKLNMCYELTKWQNATKEDQINLSVITLEDALKGFYYPILRPLSDLTEEIEVNGKNL